MLACQRDHFDMPRDICFMNAAAYSPLPKRVQAAAHDAIGRKAQPWRLDPGLAHDVNERARSAAAHLINADPADVALVSSVGYGVATAAKVLDIPAGSRVLVLENDHTSPVLEWMTRAEAGGYRIDIISRQGTDSWTDAVMAAIEQPHAPPLSLLSISNVHWADGGIIDLDQVLAAARRHGAAVLVDATHAVGMMDLDVPRLDPDFVCFPTYKWLVGPYGRAFLYAAKRHQHGVPLEQIAPARKGVKSEAEVYFADLSYVDDARRYDMGERDHFISMEMAAVAMEMIAAWGPVALGNYSGTLTTQLAEGLSDLPGIDMLPAADRTPNILSLGFPSGMPDQLPERLADQGIFTVARLGRLRISPHIYNDSADVERFIEVFRSIMR